MFRKLHEYHVSCETVTQVRKGIKITHLPYYILSTSITTKNTMNTQMQIMLQWYNLI